MKNTSQYIKSACAILALASVGCGVCGCGAKPTVQKAAPASTAPGKREAQAQQYILQRRAAARNSRRTHTSH